MTSRWKKSEAARELYRKTTQIDLGELVVILATIIFIVAVINGFIKIFRLIC